MVVGTAAPVRAVQARAEPVKGASATAARERCHPELASGGWVQAMEVRAGLARAAAAELPAARVVPAARAALRSIAA